MLCPKCKNSMNIEVSIVWDGCCAGNDRCYCSTPDIETFYVCPKNYSGRCRQFKIPIHELNDIGSLSRWLTNNYKKGDK